MAFSAIQNQFDSRVFSTSFLLSVSISGWLGYETDFAQDSYDLFCFKFNAGLAFNCRFCRAIGDKAKVIPDSGSLLFQSWDQLSRARPSFLTACLTTFDSGF
ncbi:hypothetical protein EVAR_41445_1 [Eumeta japonica]|uniref:Uncharacterized protein n=1 Tax=Eumeta variegata TaxID=151549 RepID=A0A4C1W6C3_EUMVA|nr:hypothetical protein EVAR_41445_1 [Eumeta japonica]